MSTHPDIHLLVHSARAAELRTAARTPRPPRRDLRSRLGWSLVELGLRIATAPPLAPQPAR